MAISTKSRNKLKNPVVDEKSKYFYKKKMDGGILGEQERVPGSKSVYPAEGPSEAWDLNAVVLCEAEISYGAKSRDWMEFL